MAKKQNLTFEQNVATEQHLKPYCEQAVIVAKQKAKADELRPLASEELKAKLDANPDTCDFTGTVVYLCGGKVYKLRVQRPDNTNWRAKRLNDPNLKEYKSLMNQIDKKKERADELRVELAKAHPKSIERGFVMGLLSK